VPKRRQEKQGQDQRTGNKNERISTSFEAKDHSMAEPKTTSALRPRNQIKIKIYICILTTDDMHHELATTDVQGKFPELASNNPNEFC